MFVDLFVDFEHKTVTKVYPYAIHCDGFTYPAMAAKIQIGLGLLIKIEDEEEIEIYTPVGWQELDVYTENHE